MPRYVGPVPRAQAKEGSMPQLVKKRRSAWAVLAVSAMFASLLAVAATPVGAVDDKSKQDAKADTTACVEGVIESAGFEDVPTDHELAPDINCLAYYKVTLGTSEGMFSPGDDVTRGQMALFLYRAATSAGIDLMGGEMTAEFDDIESYFEDGQAAIKAMARNGILEGRDGSFHPNVGITRVDMAKALVALLAHTDGNDVSKNKDGLFVITNFVGSYDSFADVKATEPAGADRAVGVAYELGITNGAGDGTLFAPRDTVTRAQMAAFIVRTLAHTTVRPAGVTAQVTDTNIVVSVRDADFQPLANRVVDVFYAPSSTASDRAFKADGSCNFVTKTEIGRSSCEIDNADLATNISGNANFGIGEVNVGDGITVWTWTGNVGDKYGASTESFNFDIDKAPATPVEGNKFKISSSLSDDATHVSFGSTITVTVQLQGVSAGQDVDTGNQGKFGNPAVARVWEASIAVDSFSGEKSEVSGVGSSLSRASGVKLDDSGALTFDVSVADPSATASNTVTARFQITLTNNDRSNRSLAASLARNLDNNTNVGDDVNDSVVTGYIVFTDAASAASKLKIDHSGSRDAPATGTAADNVKVTALDQYGLPKSGVSVLFCDATTGLDVIVPTRVRFTARDGSVTVGYSFSSTGTGRVISVSARYADSNDDNVVDCNDDSQADANVYWVSGTPGTGSNDGWEVAVFNGDLNTVVVNPTAPVKLTYDSNDQFNVVGSNGVTIDAFEKAVADGVGEKNCNGNDACGTLIWSSYPDPLDPAKVAIFTYTPPS